METTEKKQSVSDIKQKAKEPKTAKEFKEKRKTELGDISKLEPGIREKVQEILNSNDSNYVKSYWLSQLNFNNGQIASFMGVSRRNVARDLWMVRLGKRETPKI